MAIADAASKVGAEVQIGKTLRRISDDSYVVRFTLWSGTTEQYDRVIAALFELDANAVVRSARAVYESKADFEAQRKARVS
jgi:hypothetical protein